MTLDIAMAFDHTRAASGCHRARSGRRLHHEGYGQAVAHVADLVQGCAVLRVPHGRRASCWRIVAIMGELDRAGLLHGDVGSVHSKTLRDGLEQWDIRRRKARK